ncbi:MAG: hypothetical protein GY940_00770 [bacterium]|nr:hypothetical protein [bacterium]
MHPFLRTPKQFLMVGLLWSPICFLVVFLLVGMTEVNWGDAVLWTVPPMMVEFFMGLSLWFLCRTTMRQQWRFIKTLWAHLIASILLNGFWLLLVLLYTQLLDVMFKTTVWSERYVEVLPVFLAVGVSLYFIAILIHYLVLVVEKNRRVEEEVLNQKVLAGESELRALKATVHPHFLFNSLNMLGPLMRSSITDAQTVVSQLSEFLLYSLRYVKQEQVTVRDEVEHVRNYLAIESVRLADRLKLEWDIDDSVLDAAMLPLTLLPLVENAIKHGIGQRLEGGTLSISITRKAGGICVRMTNPYDEPTHRPRGEGMGIDTLKHRFNTCYGHDAQVITRKENNIFKVELQFPQTIENRG